MVFSLQYCYWNYRRNCRDLWYSITCRLLPIMEWFFCCFAKYQQLGSRQENFCLVFFEVVVPIMFSFLKWQVVVFILCFPHTLKNSEWLPLALCCRRKMLPVAGQNQFALSKRIKKEKTEEYGNDFKYHRGAVSRYTSRRRRPAEEKLHAHPSLKT